MSFKDSNLDDSPRTRVLEIEPDCTCTPLYWNGRREGFSVTLRGNTLATATTAYEAWRKAEAKLTEVSV